MSIHSNTGAFIDFLMKFKTWDYDRQTRAIEDVRAEDSGFAEIADIMAEIRDGKREGRAAA